MAQGLSTRTRLTHGFGAIATPLTIEATLVDWTEKRVDSNWTWLTDYFFLRSEWSISIPEGRRTKIASGVSVRGTPLGRQHTLGSGNHTIQAFGAGALHAKSADNKGPVTVKFVRGDYKLASWTEPTG